MKYSDECMNCGAWEGLHHFETMQCPKGGREAPIEKKQEYAKTIFIPKIEVETEELTQFESWISNLEKRIEKLEKEVKSHEKEKGVKEVSI